LVSIRLIDESAHAQSSITKSALFYDLCFTFSHNLGRLPPDEVAVREAREAATGSDEIHPTYDGGMGICIVALMQLFALLFRRAGLPLPPC
jgi:hypothetical protein